MLRLIRLLMQVQQYRAFVATFFTLIPSLMPFMGIIFCILCIYCSLGLQIFGGLVNAGNPKLEGTDLSDNDYLLFNFKDYQNGMVTLFNLLIMGNWQAWMQVTLICHDHLYLLFIHTALCMTEEYVNLSLQFTCDLCLPS
ncbi:two pore calcium channel protein 1A-like isoform X1 [Camellia sinensis]|uniref:two pore calcium channel protein 1A-like isoform X1 n=1 Tax=Camellia sinensis TaxID=4442 RepID=UPI001035798D|nr:two pore calcium channel protein 1A-like isoform X1 [Camellia sinensis]